MLGQSPVAIKHTIEYLVCQLHSGGILIPVSNFFKKLSFFNFFLRYSKCSKISNTFLFLFSNKMLVFRAGIHKFLARVANSEDPDQTASKEAV